MINIFIAIILVIFFGLFAAMAFPMKDELAKLNKSKNSSQASKLQDS